MKSIQIAGVSLTTSPKRRLARAGVLLIACIASIPAQAATIGIAYSNAGDLTGDPVQNGNILTLDALANGSVISGNPALNAIWNPVTFHTHDMLDVTTGLDQGVFTMTFANGDTLSGNIAEVDSADLLANNIGAFTQTLTFTGGTGEFVGASGSTSGGGLVGDNGFTTSGSGTLTAAGVSAPEPASVALILGGLVVMVARRKLVRQQR
jgi:hypothetical protein